MTLRGYRGFIACCRWGAKDGKPAAMNIRGGKRDRGRERGGDGCRGAREIQSNSPVEIIGKTKCSTACICSSNDVSVVMVDLMLAPGLSLWRIHHTSHFQHLSCECSGQSKPGPDLLAVVLQAGRQQLALLLRGELGVEARGGPLLPCREALAGQLALQHVVLCSQPCPSAMEGPLRLCLAELLVMRSTWKQILPAEH